MIGAVVVILVIVSFETLVMVEIMVALFVMIVADSVESANRIGYRSVSHA